MRSCWTRYLVRSTGIRAKGFNLTPFAIGPLLFIFMFLVLFSGYAWYRIHVLGAQVTQLAAVKNKNLEQGRRIVELSERVARLDEEMGEIRGYNRHLSGMSLINREVPEGINGIGGGADGSGAPETAGMLAQDLDSLIQRLGEEVGVQKEVAKGLLADLERSRSIFAHTPGIWPVRGWLTSDYGWRDSPFSGRREFHKGIDIASEFSSDIHAPADGIVTSYGKNGNLGNYMVISHGYGIVTRYGHLDRSYVPVGRQVRKGQRIASLGNTGRSTGAHLHYEVLVDGIQTNPQRYLLK